MCEPAVPLDLLRTMRFSLSALAACAGTPGSFERRNAENAVKGIESDLNWCIAQLEAAKEGQRNMGVHPYPQPAKESR